VWAGAALGLALVLGGCSSSTAPASLKDPLATAAQAAALDSAFGSPVLASFQSLGSSIHAAPPVVQPAVRALGVVRPQLGPDHYAALAAAGRTLRQVVPSFASFGATIFPDTLLGSVFSWDPNLQSYYRSSTTGGPTNGIRFLLYAIDPFTDEPATPLNQVGYADLLDESSGGTARLEVQVKSADGSITYLDYTFSGSGTSSSFMASVTGTITNGLAGAANKTLTFNVEITGTSSSVTLASSYTLNNPTVTVLETVTSADDGTTTTLTLDFTLTAAGDTVQLTGTVSVSDATGDGTVNLTFKVNGGTFATITGSTGNPVISRAGGGQVTADDLNALVRVFEAAADVADKVDELCQPAEQMLGL
jgi:hypothetical protein